MTDFNVFILSIFDMMMIFISNGLLENRKIINAGSILYIIFGALLISVNGMFVNSELLAHLTSTPLNLIWLMLFLRKTGIKLRTSFELYVLTFLIIFILQFASVMIIKLISSTFEYNFYYGIMSQMLATAIVLFIYKYLFFTFI